MKASKFTDTQKEFIMKQGEKGTPIAEICRKAGTTPRAAIRLWVTSHPSRTKGSPLKARISKPITAHKTAGTPTPVLTFESEPLISSSKVNSHVQEMWLGLLEQFWTVLQVDFALG